MRIIRVYCGSGIQEYYDEGDRSPNVSFALPGEDDKAAKYEAEQLAAGHTIVQGVCCPECGVAVPLTDTVPWYDLDQHRLCQKARSK